MVCQSDLSLFVWHDQTKLNELLCRYVNDFIFGGTQTFLKNNVTAPMKCSLTVGVKHCGAMKYLGLNINLSVTEIILDQIDYINSLKYINIPNDIKKNEEDSLLPEENDNIKSLVK